MKKIEEVKVTNSRNILATIVATICIIGLIVLLVQINNNKEKTVAVVKVKSDIYPNGLITEQSLEKYEIPLTEYNKYKGQKGQEYLKWDDVEKCKNQYSTVYTKKYICVGDYEPTRPVKNEWLTKAEDGSIFISLPYEKNDAFGNILTPGDYVKIGISYTDMVQSADGYGSATSNEDEILFDKIQVVDMLNSKGNSIYDYYTDLLSLSVNDREKELRDDNFLNNVSPTDVLLKVSANEDFSKYMKVQKYSGLKYTYGLYPRIENDTVLSQFSDLTRQITAAQTAAMSKTSDTKGGDK